LPSRNIFRQIYLQAFVNDGDYKHQARVGNGKKSPQAKNDQPLIFSYNLNCFGENDYQEDDEKP
jgi:hypothetical protein